MKMANSEYWDESEFNFFSTLEDVDKLLYIYDLMIGEFVYEYEGNDGSLEFDFDFEPEDELQENRIDVRMEFIRDGVSDKIVLSGTTLSVLEKVATDLMLNGMLLMNRTVEFTKFEPWEVQLSYDLIGNASPISVN